MKLNKVIGAILLAMTLPLAAQQVTTGNQSTPDSTMSSKVLSTIPGNNMESEPVLSTDLNTTDMQAELNFAKGWTNRELTMDEERRIRKSFESRFPGIKVDAVNVTPMPGVYEVQVGLDLLYANATVDYVLQGSLIDAKERRDLTAERLEGLQKVAFDSLPLENAVKQVKGTGEHVFAMFEDPNCGYCKQLHQSLEQIDNTTIYTFLFPILSPDSGIKSRNVWCSDDPAQVWHDWMVNGVRPSEAECDTPLQDNLDLGRKLKVQGTPALFFPDGTRVNGALPLEALRERFN